jgi:hypothetical protein
LTRLTYPGWIHRPAARCHESTPSNDKALLTR